MPALAWDPLGLSADDDVALLRYPCSVEIKHGRVCTAGFIMPQVVDVCPGVFPPFCGMKFANVPLPGWLQMVAEAGCTMYQGDYDEECLQHVDLVNGRSAMIAINGILLLDGFWQGGDFIMHDAPRGTLSRVSGAGGKPELGLQPVALGEACCGFWQGGDFIMHDAPRGKQVFCQMDECSPAVVEAMRDCIRETGVAQPSSANITAADNAERVARGKYVLSQFGPLSLSCVLLVDGYVAGGTAVTVARRSPPTQMVHHHRGYTAFVHTTLSSVIGASGICVGTGSAWSDWASRDEACCGFWQDGDFSDWASRSESGLRTGDVDSLDADSEAICDYFDELAQELRDPEVMSEFAAMLMVHPCELV